MSAIYPDTCNLFLSAAESLNHKEVVAFMANENLQIQNARSSVLHVYDLLGKELLQERILTDNESIDVGGLPNGILLVVVETETGRFTKKLVKTSY